MKEFDNDNVEHRLSRRSSDTTSTRSSRAGTPANVKRTPIIRIHNKRNNELEKTLEIDTEDSYDDLSRLLGQFNRPVSAKDYPRSLKLPSGGDSSVRRRRRHWDESETPASSEPLWSSEIEQELLEKLALDTDIIKSRATSVERYFGSRLATFHDTLEKSQVSRKLPIESKKRVVDRDKILLETDARPRSSNKIHRSHLRTPAQQASKILERSVTVQTKPPLTIKNTLDDQKLHGKFQFISDYVYRPGVRVVDKGADYGCNCQETCGPPTCLCKPFNDQSQNAPIIAPYIRNHYGVNVLSDEFLESLQRTDAPRSEIVECNQYCSCSQDCVSRVVQKGRQIPLEIFMTAKCGFGVRSSKPVYKGQFIDNYLGEVISEKELERREKLTDAKTPSYLFRLDWFTPESNDNYHIDGKNFGSATRFVNHSCEPNCYIVPVMMNHADRKVYRLSFFATKNIPPMGELTIDYNPQEAVKQEEASDEADLDPGATRCQCGASKCRGRLWPGAEKRARPRGRPARSRMRYD